MFYSIEHMDAMSVRVSTEAFELLDTIARRGSYAKAAEELDRATSAVSYGVQKLEEQLGITLFVREGRRSVMTPAAQLLLTEGRGILAATERAADRARELANGWEPRIRIALESTLNLEVFFSVLAAFQAERADIEIDIRETLLNGTWEALADDAVELVVGAVGPVPAHKGFRAEMLCAADLVPVISPEHADAERLLGGGDLRGVQRVVNHDTVLDDVARSAGFNLQGHRVLYVQTMEQKLQAILAGLGVGHLPRYSIGDLLAQGKLQVVASEHVNPEQFVAYKLTNRGGGVKLLAQGLVAASW